MFHNSNYKHLEDLKQQEFRERYASWKLLRFENPEIKQQSFVLHIRVQAFNEKKVFEELKIAMFEYIPKKNFSIIFRFNYENVEFKAGEKKHKNIDLENSIIEIVAGFINLKSKIQILKCETDL